MSRHLSLEMLEPRAMLAADFFSAYTREQIPVPELLGEGVRIRDSFTVDLNGDERLDLVAATSKQQVVALLRQDDGGFRVLPSETLPGLIREIGHALVDINGDDWLDVLVRTGVGVVPLLGRDFGLGFSAGPLVEVPSLLSIDSGDLNRDGFLDLVIGSFGGVVDVRFGDGTGAFGEPTSYPDLFPLLVAVGDVDGNGYPDISVADRISVTLLINQQDGTFEAATETTGRPALFPEAESNSGITQTELADLDGDGRSEILVGYARDFPLVGYVARWQFKDDGLFEIDPDPEGFATRLNSGPAEIVVRDFNNDAVLDIFVRGENIFFDHDGLMREFLGPELVYYSNADGTFDASFVDIPFRLRTSLDSAQHSISVSRGVFVLIDETVDIYRPAIRGDVNLDGAVDFADFLILSANFGKDSAAWEDGDVNLDSVVDFADFLVLASNFGQRESRRS